MPGISPMKVGIDKDGKAIATAAWTGDTIKIKAAERATYGSPLPGLGKATQVVHVDGRKLPT